MSKYVNITKDTYNKLQVLIEDENTPYNSFSDVVSHLLDLEDKYNALEETIEYEYELNNGFTKLFRITFIGNSTAKPEYYNIQSGKFEDNIRAWQTGNSMSEEELDSFIQFIVDEKNTGNSMSEEELDSFIQFIVDEKNRFALYITKEAEFTKDNIRIYRV